MHHSTQPGPQTGADTFSPTARQGSCCNVKNSWSWRYGEDQGGGDIQGEGWKVQHTSTLAAGDVSAKCPHLALSGIAPSPAHVRNRHQSGPPPDIPARWVHALAP